MKAFEPTTAKIEVIVVFSNEDKELVQNVNANLNSNNEIMVSSVMSDLKIKGYSIEGLLVAYFCEERNIYVHIGRDPVPEEALIPATDKMRINLRFRQDSESHASADRIFSMGNSKQAVSVRSKERKISEILEKVALWRRLYGGVRSKEGEVVQYSLEDAAKHVGISKKSLDDYLLQIKLGKKYGFDFNANKDRGVGTLRSFVKKHRKLNGGNDSSAKDSDDELPLSMTSMPSNEAIIKATMENQKSSVVRQANMMNGNGAIVQMTPYNTIQLRNLQQHQQQQQMVINPEMMKNYSIVHNVHPNVYASNAMMTQGVTTTPITTTGAGLPAGIFVRNIPNSGIQSPQ